MANGRIDGQGLVDDSAVQIFVDLDNKVVESIGNVNRLEKAIRNALTPSGLSSTSNQSVNAIRQANTQLSEQEKVYRQLNIARERNTQVSNESLRQLIRERERRNQMNKELRQEERLNLSLEGSYKRLRLERDKAGRTLRDLIVSGKANNAELRVAQREYDRLNTKVRRADAAISRFGDNVGNYESALVPLIRFGRELIGVFGVVEGLRLTLDFAQEASQLARQARGVEFAFEQLGITGVKAFNDVKEASNGAISDLEIKRALVELDNFNISLEQAGTLFEFLTVRSLQTGQSIDKLGDSLVEGLSKESLLRIDNLGISTAELNKELEKTPVFVDAVANIARREIAEAGDIIDEASNSSEALNAAWENFTVSVGQAINRLGGLRAVVGIVQRLSETQAAINQSYQEGGNVLDEYLIRFRQFTTSGREENRRLVEEARLRKLATEEIREQARAYAELNGSIGPLLEGQDEAGFSFVPPEEDVRTLAAINAELEEQRKLLQEGNISSREEALVIQNKIAELNKEKEAIIGSNAVRQTTVSLINGTVKAYENEILKLKEVRDSTATTTKEYEEFNKEIKELEDRLKLLQDPESLKIEVEAQGIEATENIFGIDTEGTNQALEVLAEEAQKRADQLKLISETNADDLKQIYQGVFDTFSSYYGLDLTAFENLLSGKQNSLQDYANTARSITQTITDSVIIGYQNEIQANQDRLDEVLNSEEATEKQKIAAQKKFDEEQRQIRIKQARAERNAILIQIAIDTAAAVAKVLSQTGIFAPAAIPTIIALGAAQAAFVAAQPLPQFYKGKGPLDDYEGPATWGERRREVLVDKDGNIVVSPNKATPLMVKKDDIITPSIDSFQRLVNRPGNEVFRRVSNNLKRDTDNRIMIANGAQPKIDTRAIELAVERGMKKVKIHNTIHNVIEREKIRSYLKPNGRKKR